MTADVLASFAERPGALTYANVCARWGMDPSAGITDDVLAFNLRAALTIRMNESEAEQLEESETPDPFAAAREAGAKVKAMGG
jgi:hypothetical protein